MSIRFSHAGLLAILVFLLLPQLAAAQAPATLVKTDNVTTSEFHDQITLIGRTEARVHSSIVAEVSGRVIAINAAEGNRIRKGQPLVTVDTSRIALSLKAKKAEATQAQQQAMLAKNNLERAEELYQQQLVPESTIDSARAWYTSAQARYDELDAQRALLALDLENCVVSAPYDGYTLRRAVDVGDWVQIGTPVYEMVDISAITVEVDLPEKHYNSLSIGSEASIIVSGQEKAYGGTVTGMARSAALSTHTFPVLITVRNTNGELGGGKLVKATLSLNDQFSSLAVDKDAIVRSNGQTMLYTIADGKAAPIMVSTGSTKGRMVAISGEGLAEGMPVVVRGNERIYPGAPVTTGDAQPAAASEDNATETAEAAGSQES